MLPIQCLYRNIRISDLTVFVVFLMYHSLLLSLLCSLCAFPTSAFNHFPSIRTVCFQLLAPFLHRFFKLLFKIVFYFSSSTKSLECFCFCLSGQLFTISMGQWTWKKAIDKVRVPSFLVFYLGINILYDLLVPVI